MTAAVTTDDRHSRVPLRVLIAVHGYEAPGWAEETCRLVASWTGPSLRVVAVLDVPTPPFTSLTGAAQRAYAGARARWAEIERGRLEASTSALVRGLGREADVVAVPAMRGDLARTIAEQARAWPADLVVVGGPTPGLRSWLRTGPIHERVVRLASCAVLVPTPARVGLRGLRRVAPRPSTIPAAVAERA
jgi:nucleotide-binding universal stress UspA family protein